MHDFVTLSNYSDQQLQEMLQNIQRKLSCPMSEAAMQLMANQRDLILDIMQERRTIESLKNPPLPPMNLTVDELSEKEKSDEEKNRK